MDLLQDGNEIGVPLPRSSATGGLYARMRDVMRARCMSLRSEKAYLGWVRRFIRFLMDRLFA
jgi:hypothetical protein